MRFRFELLFDRHIELGNQESQDNTPPSTTVSWQLAAAIALLVAVWLFNELTDIPVKLVYPYALAVGLVAWQHRLIWGFLFAAFATVIALVSEAFPTHPTSAGLETIEGLITYVQLSFVCVVVYFVKRLRHERHR